MIIGIALLVLSVGFGLHMTAKSLRGAADTVTRDDDWSRSDGRRPNFALR